MIADIIVSCTGNNSAEERLRMPLAAIDLRRVQHRLREPAQVYGKCMASVWHFGGILLQISRSECCHNWS